MPPKIWPRVVCIDRTDIRNRIKEQRIAMKREDVIEESRRIQKQLFDLSEFINARTITFYAAKKSHNEVETEGMIRDSLNMGKRILVPITDKGRKVLIFSEIKNYLELKPQTFLIPEPTQENYRLIDAYKTDLIIVPGIVFNLCGYRLGYGFGYYDKFLAGNLHKIPQIGLAYHFQIADFPVEEHDIPLDKIVTEECVIECATLRNGGSISRL